MTEPVGGQEARRLPVLTSLRWYAALLVFLFHFLQTSGLAVLRPLASGYVGVSFFFVLSGFVLTWGTTPGTSARRFWWNRAARIYPPHLAMFVVAALAFALLPAISEGKGLGPALAALFLVSAWWAGGRGYDEVSWSLSDEAFFYLLFPVLTPFLARRRRAGVVIVAVALAVGLYVAWVASRHGLAAANTAYFNPALRLPEFLLGVELALLVRAGRLPRVPLGLAAVLCGLLLLVNWRLTLPMYPVTDYVALPGFALLVVAGAQADASGDQSRLLRVLRRRWSLYLGELSFAFYLVHRLVLRGLQHGVPTGSAPADLLWLGLSVVASFLAAVALRELVEQPARRRLLALARRRATAPRPARPTGVPVLDHPSAGGSRPSSERSQRSANR